MGMEVPEEYGGAGVDDFRFNASSRGDRSAPASAASALGLTLHNDICLPYFLRYANEEQKERWLPGIASGELHHRDRDDRARHRLRPRRHRHHGRSATATHYVVNGVEDVHHERDQRRPGHHRGPDRPDPAPRRA